MTLAFCVDAFFYPSTGEKSMQMFDGAHMRQVSRDIIINCRTVTETNDEVVAPREDTGQPGKPPCLITSRKHTYAMYCNFLQLQK